jgi:small subunit ribosomal protein S27e
MFVKLSGADKSFVKIKCPDCGSETITYSRGSTEVKCSVCNTVIAKPSGGKILINGTVTGEYK